MKSNHHQSNKNSAECADSKPKPILQNLEKQTQISVIIPTYNNADILPACLEALLAQEYPHDKYEIIVVDDGSTDHTSEVVSQFTDSIPVVRYFHQANQGPAAARNNGAKHAAGDIIMFTDDDCVAEPQWIIQMSQPFHKSNGDIAAVKGAYKTRQSSFIAHFAQKEFESRYRKMQKSRHIDFVDTYSAAFKREVFFSLNGFDTRFPEANNEDVEFSYRLAAENHKMVFNPDAIVYHTHPDTLYKYLKMKFGRAYWRMAVYKSFPDKMLSDSYTPQTLKLQIILSFLLLASLVVSLFYDTSLAISLALIALFVVSTIPFVAGVLNFAWLNRIDAFLKNFLKPEVIFKTLHKLYELFFVNFLYEIVTHIGKWLQAIMHGLITVFRKILESTPVAYAQKLIKIIGKLLINTIVFMLKAVWLVICLPITIARIVLNISSKGYKYLSNFRLIINLGLILQKIAKTRIVMALLSVPVLFLRAVVMGLGTLWGLQSQQTKKGRFSQIFLVVFFDIIGLIGAFFVAYYSKHYLFDPFLSNHILALGAYLQYLPFFVMFVLAVFFLSGLYKPYKGLSQVTEFVLLTKSVFTITVFTISVLYLTSSDYSHAVVMLTCTLFLIIVSCLRAFLRGAFSKYSSLNGKGGATRILIVGTGELARLICKKLQTTPDVDSVIVGFIEKSPDKVGKTVDGHQIIGCFEDIREIIEDYHIKEVFVALPLESQMDVIDLIDKNSQREGVHFHIISNLFDLITAELDIAESNNIPITYLRNENMALLQLFMKRVFDILFSTVVIILTFPMWIFVIVALKLETDGPAIFRQERVGRHGKIFQIYKFRTMYEDTAKFLYSPSSADDQRITKVGRFLRETSLDEFPQFFNVLKGDMSLVGPRPEMPFIVEQYKDWERQRLKVKPGITGLWQIMGRKDLPLHENIEYDFYYIKNQSLLLDLTLLIKTIPIILLRKGAY
jgi:exopolysaccharide biosynthesis polyprenyl glycosylphosphotransferase